MKRKSPMPLRSNHIRLGLCIAAALGATAAGAETIDVGTELAKRLRAAGKLDAIYKIAKPGQTMPASMPAAVYFEGTIRGRGLSIVAPPPLSNPKVMQQNEIVNCGDTQIEQTLEINSTSSNTTSFENSDQIGTEHLMEVSLEVSYKIGDLGSKAGFKDSWKKSNVTMRKDGGSTTESLTWKNSPKIPVPAQKMAIAQFVISEEQVSRVPYTANYILEGDARLVFNAGAEGFRWVQRIGASLPTAPHAPLSFGKNGTTGAPMYACRVARGDGYVVGTSMGPDSPCFTAAFGKRVMLGLVGGAFELAEDGTYEWLVGNQAALDAALGAPGATGPFDAGKKMQLCLANAPGAGSTVPGFVQSDGSCASLRYGDPFPKGTTYTTRDFKVLLDPTQGGVETRVKLNDYLTEAQRTLDIRGVFSGVQSVDGFVRVGNVPADCSWLKAGPTPVQASGGPKGPAAPPRHVRVANKAPGPLLPDSSAKIPLPRPLH